MSDYKGRMVIRHDEDLDVIDARDKTSMHPDLMKTFMVISDKKDGNIKCWEMNVINTISHYIENHPEDFKKILEYMDYSYIEDIYGEVASIDKIFEYYSFEEAFDKYIKWVEKMEKDIKFCYRYGHELLELPLSTYHCGNCHELVYFPYSYDWDYKPDFKCSSCGHDLYTTNQYRFRYGFNYNTLFNRNILELVNINEL